LSRNRHSSVPLKRTSTGVGFELKSGVKGLRAEFDAWRHKYEAALSKLQADNAELVAALEAADAALNACARFMVGTGPQPTPELLGPAITAVAVALKKARGE
jgi:hypothetical protein